MAYGTLLTGDYSARDGTDVEVYVDRQGYSSTTYDARVEGDTLSLGAQADGLFAIARQAQASVSFVESGLPVEEAKRISQGTAETHRLRVDHDGTEIYRGYCNPETTTLRISETMRNVFTVRAQTQIGGLEGSWRKDDGTLYTGKKALSTILAGIFDDLGIPAPIEIVMDWRPTGLSDSDHPLQIEANSEAWKRTDSDGQTVVESRGKVLHDCVGTFLSTVVLDGGIWKIRQPTAYRGASSVTVYEYDSAGAYQTSRSESATSDISSEAWLEDSDEVSGMSPHRESRVVYDHGASPTVDFNGSFEDGGSSSADGWNFPTNDFDISPRSPNSDSDRSLEIQGESKLAPSATDEDMQAAADESASATLGAYAPGSETVDLTLFYQSRRGDGSGGRASDIPESIKLYWAVDLQTSGGNTYWFVEGTGWVLEGNLAAFDDRLNSLVTSPSAASWQDKTVTVPQPPENGEMKIYVFEPISRLDTSGADDYKFWGYWDELSLSRSITGASKTLFRSYEEDRATGETFERKFRIGDGPYEGSPGALFLPGGDFTGAWRIVGEAGTYALHELLVKESLSALSDAPQLIRAKLPEPSTDPAPGRAATFAGKRMWPSLVEWIGGEDRYRVALVELVDNGQANGFQLIAGGEDEVTSGTGSSPGGGGEGSTAWEDITGKPSSLFARNGGGDGFDSTEELLEANIDISGSWTFESDLSVVGNLDVEGKIKQTAGTHTTAWASGDFAGGFALELQTEDKSGSLASRIVARGGTDTADIEFLSGASGSESVEVILQNGGTQVGIGTTSPNGKLDVRGITVIDGYNFKQNANGHLAITTPSGNQILLKDDGDVEAFA